MQNKEVQVDSILIDTILTKKIIPIKEEIIPVTQRIIVETKQFETKETKDDNCTLCDCNLLISLIWPITLLLILIYFRTELKRLLSNISGRIRKIKIGGFELELEDLKRQTEQVERKYSDRGLKYQNYETIEELYLNNDVRATFLTISIEIEKTIRDLYLLVSDNYKNERKFQVSAMIETLRQRDVFDMELTLLLRKFWMFRNGIVHAIKYDISEKEFKSFVDIGVRILRILNIIEQKLRAK
tara:strand:- start:1655 stop:2380 length:726 start_codon:yes stop_codon:yes gene_type:complete